MEDVPTYQPIAPDPEKLAELSRRVAELKLERNRYGKRRLTNNQRLKQLWRIYDGALAWLEGALLSGRARGTGAATIVLDRTRLEILAIERREGISPEAAAPQVQLKVDLSGFSAEDLETLKQLREKAKK